MIRAGFEEAHDFGEGSAPRRLNLNQIAWSGERDEQRPPVGEADSGPANHNPVDTNRQCAGVSI